MYEILNVQGYSLQNYFNREIIKLGTSDTMEYYEVVKKKKKIKKNEQTL